MGFPNRSDHLGRPQDVKKYPACTSTFSKHDCGVVAWLLAICLKCRRLHFWNLGVLQADSFTALLAEAARPQVDVPKFLQPEHFAPYSISHRLSEGGTEMAEARQRLVFLAERIIFKSCPCKAGSSHRDRLDRQLQPTLSRTSTQLLKSRMLLQASFAGLLQLQSLDKAKALQLHFSDDLSSVYIS